MKQLNEEAHKIVIYKLNPSERELNGEVDFDSNVNGRILYGIFYLHNNNLIVIDEDEVKGIFNLDYFYFLKSSN